MNNGMLERLLQVAEISLMMVPIVVGAVLYFHRVSVRLIQLENRSTILERVVQKLIRISVNNDSRILTNDEISNL